MHDHSPSQDVPETIDALLDHNASLARSIVHKLQAGVCLDAHLGSEFRYLEWNLELWREFFSRLGYALHRSELGGEPFYYLTPQAAVVSTSRLGRGSTFLGLYLSWYFMSQGMERMDHVPARELAETLTASFDFTMLITVFNPIQKGKTRQRQESRKQFENLKGWLRTGLNELHRLRYIQLGPTQRTQWEELMVYRLPGLQRFWDLARDALALGESPETVDLSTSISRVWNAFEPEAEAETEDETDSPLADADLPGEDEGNSHAPA
ncbi:condensin complex protein MksE [Desulfohalobium retbaense]|uniref:Uncharacterized protein n=1 Tax=Desulfohalobium retbaense (strain ATCC 49708 / DSM 5692 / JCM 16813 / HR100) TaxID=485915 RepID=C8X2Y1_DESRD|nr:hypothetical protein [Desulfohalobium retbaense]ACV68778.1 hypothetical protein Dret_1492 [Desulfohalobium retbaense DSM 5692]